MGERYQIHTIYRREDERHPKNPTLMSIHLQWCWGGHIIRNLNRILTTLSKTKYEYVDGNEFNKYVLSILNVNQDLDKEYFYPFIHEGERAYDTFRGDSNHGWVIIEVINKKDKFWDVKCRFYDTEGNPKTNEALLGDAVQELEAWKQNTPKNRNAYKRLMKLFNNTKEDLQKTFNDLVAHSEDE